MKSLKYYLQESKGQSINQQWLDSKKPVITRDGRNVLIEKIDYSEIPNVIYGKVAWKEQSFDFKWDDTGKCIEAADKMGNPCAPAAADDLVRAF